MGSEGGGMVEVKRGAGGAGGSYFPRLGLPGARKRSGGIGVHSLGPTAEPLLKSGAGG